MSTFRCRMFAFLSIFFFFGPICISASPVYPDNFNTLTPEEQTTIKQVISYLSSHSLSPFIGGGKTEYVHLGFIKDSYNNNTHALGKVTQRTDSCIALFSIKKTWFWNEIKTDFVYATNDTPISPVLFADIVHHGSILLSKDLSNSYAFIEKKKDPRLPKESKLQKWTFIDQQKSEELLVVLTDDGKGGTYFTIRQPN